MATTLPSTTFLPATSSFLHQKHHLPSLPSLTHAPSKRVPFTVCAAKPPAGVVTPKVEPKLQAPFLGFTRTAEVWNSRACMIGLIGTFIVELIIHKGILQVIGVDIGKGLDLPL